MNENIEKDFKDLLDNILDYNPKADVEIVKKAWEFAKLAHFEQKRLSGDDFISHPLEVAKTLAHWKLDTSSIIVGLLHDTIEQGGATREDLNKEFGETVALLVDGVTKVTSLRLKESKKEIFVENLRKMILVMAKDLRVVLVKLADRLHNMETLSYLPSESQRENARETIEIYAPLGERLGMGEVKGRLEDLAFPYLYPEDYAWVKKYSDPYYKKEAVNVKESIRRLQRALAEEKLEKFEVHGRAKHLYSLWRKLLRPENGKDITRIHDLVALRVMVETVGECYLTLGVVHKLWKPVPHIGIRDFIAQPKPNGYRSIHTSVFGKESGIMEIQIRTFEMHEQAEHGIAAHWHLSELKTKGAVGNKDIDKGEKARVPSKLDWVRNLVDWQKELTDSEEFLEAVKFDALSHRNFVFSPHGDCFDLPAGATPVDFAYAVHTVLGNSVAGAKVDGKMVPLNYKLKSGEVVEIIKSKLPERPTDSWLDFVVTTLAKSEINKYLRSKVKR